jgi:hypothetical protein
MMNQENIFILYLSKYGSFIFQVLPEASAVILLPFSLLTGKLACCLM